MKWLTLPDFIRGIDSLSIAYNKVFDRKNQFTKDVLKDLASFCRAHESTFHQDPRLHAVLEGRREVWLRIEQYLELTTSELYELHKIREVRKPNETSGQTNKN